MPRLDRQRRCHQLVLLDETDPGELGGRDLDLVHGAAASLVPVLEREEGERERESVSFGKRKAFRW